jgi:HSP20 family protein
MKTLTLYRPHAIQHALSDVDRFFDYLVGDFPLVPATRNLNRVPAVDIRETEKAYMVEMELPGYDEKNIDINVNGSILSIATKQDTASTATDKVPFIGPKEEKEKEETPPVDSASPSGSWLLRERRVTSFSRSFKLPENANPEEISAKFKNGVLTMAIQKRAEAQKRTIEINVK